MKISCNKTKCESGQCPNKNWNRNYADNHPTNIFFRGVKKKIEDLRDSRLQDLGRACFLRDISEVAAMKMTDGKSGTTVVSARRCALATSHRLGLAAEARHKATFRSACGMRLRHEMNIELPES